MAKIITVSHTKGGVGKSTIAFNLAVELKAPIVDLDFQKTLLGINSIRENKLEVLNIESSEDLRTYLKKEFDNKEYIIIDVGGFDAEVNRAAMIYADINIVPVSDSPTEISGLIKFQGIIEEIEEGIGEKIETKVLLNNIDYRKRDLSDIRELVSDRGFGQFESILHTRADFKKSMFDGLSVVEFDKNSEAAKEIKTLTKEIKKTLKKG